MSAGERWVGEVAGVRMTPLVDLIVAGDPLGKPRHRTGRSRDGRPVHYADARGRAWEDWAAWLIKMQRPGYGELREPVVLYVGAVLTRPKVLEHRDESVDRILRDQKPDGDNVVKAVADALERSGVIDNDKRIAAKAVDSWWAAIGEQPHVRIALGLPPRSVACRVRPAG